MNKRRLNQIIKILALPFTYSKLGYPKGDVLADARIQFYHATYQTESSIIKKREQERKYIASKKKLIQFVLEEGKISYQNIDDIGCLLELFYPEDILAFRIQKRNPSFTEREAVNEYYIKMLVSIAKSLLTFRDGKVAIRTWINHEESDGEEDLFEGHDTFDKVEIWNILGRVMVTDVLIAGFFVAAEIIDIKYLYNQAGGVFLADKLLENSLEKGLAETHMHFGAGIHYTFLWEKCMDLYAWKDVLREGNKIEYGDRNVLFAMMLYRMTYAEYLEQNVYTNYREYLIHEYDWENPKDLVYQKDSERQTGFYSVGRKIFQIIQKAMLEGEPIDPQEMNQVYDTLIRAWGDKYVKTKKKKSDMLLNTVYLQYRYLNTPSEMIFLFKIMKFLNLDKKHKGMDTSLFLQYIRMRNEFFENIVEQDRLEGINYFQNYLHNVIRKNPFLAKMSYQELYEKIFFSQSHNTYLKKLEIRVTPYTENLSGNDTEGMLIMLKRQILEQVKPVLMGYKAYLCNMFHLKEEYDESQLKEMDETYYKKGIGCPTIGIVFHFIKKNYIDNRTGQYCWLSREINDFYRSGHILAWRESMVRTAKAIEQLRSELPLLSEYIVGIDAASDEVNTEPWIMAPVYREIRNKRITRPIVQDEDENFYQVKNMGFTYHVGEEFRHILSGLRHIDEVIEYYGYKSGDRLGHAIALGIDLKYWMHMNEVVVIPIMEHLENLLWLWGNVVYKKMQGIDTSVYQLEGQILEYAKKIYGDITGMTVSMLYEAYQIKFLKNHRERFGRMEKLVDISKDDRKHKQKHFCKFYKEERECVWTVDKLICTYFCPVYYIKFQKPMFISIEEEEYSLFKQIQDAMIRKVEKEGYYVETNPTSNAVIGEISGIFQHPILHLNSIELKESNEKVPNCVRVTVNSDDPIVFNTDSEKELSYIYHSLVHDGYQKERILLWVDKVRQTGMDSSFISECKNPSVIIREINQLVEIIDNYIKRGK